MRRSLKWAGFVLAVFGAFALGRWSVRSGLIANADVDRRVASFTGGGIGLSDVRAFFTGSADGDQQRSAVEQLVRLRLLALDAEKAGLHQTPQFLLRYTEELARIQIETAFAEPFKNQLPTEDEVRRFFQENENRLGRPERIRLGHVALVAPRSDVAARAAKRTDAEKVLTELRRSARDEYGFGRLAMAISEDPVSRPAAGELPFLAREQLAARLGPEVADTAFAAEPGKLIDRVIETEAGFQLVKVLAREEGRPASYDELRDSIRARITAERREKAFKKFMDDLWARADVKIDEKALAELASGKSETKR